MPAGYAHEVCARKALIWLSPRDREIIMDNLPAYLLGAQGPDVLFYYGVLKLFSGHSPNRVGTLLHRQSGAVMARELLLRARGAEPSASAWALGYLSHWAADAAIHPFVFAREGEKPFAHGNLEQAADTLLFQMENKGTPEQMAFLKELSDQDIRAVAVLFALAAEHALPEGKLTAEQSEAAIRNMARILRMIYSPNGERFRQLIFWERLLRISGQFSSHVPPLHPKGDILNLRNDIWFEKGRHDVERRESFTELLEQAARQSAYSIQAALSYWDARISLEEALEEMGTLSMA